MTSFIKKSALAVTLALPLLASAQNLITNGSFESGLSGWTTSITPAGSANPVTLITYGTTNLTFGEAIPVANSASMSPDAAGTQAVYFAKDAGILTLSQTFSATVTGVYNFGLSVYVPINGSTNPFDSTVTIGVGAASQSFTVGALPVARWIEATGSTSLTAGTSYTATFTFTGNGVTAKDIVIDRAYAMAAVPEPGTYALMAAGLAAVGFLARRRRAA